MRSSTDDDVQMNSAVGIMLEEDEHRSGVAGVSSPDDGTGGHVKHDHVAAADDRQGGGVQRRRRAAAGPSRLAQRILHHQVAVRLHLQIAQALKWVVELGKRSPLRIPLGGTIRPFLVYNKVAVILHGKCICAIRRLQALPRQEHILNAIPCNGDDVGVSPIAGLTTGHGFSSDFGSCCLGHAVQG